MTIIKANIINYKCFEGKFTIDFNDGINIIVGDNESGKSTILEAINLALTGTLNGRSIKYELSQYLFNNNTVISYLNNLKTDTKTELPTIAIEVFFSPEDNQNFLGINNSERIETAGIVFKIEFDENYKVEYEELVKTDKELNGLPIEYYRTSWYSFAGNFGITGKAIPIKASLIDSSASRFQNSSDIYISRIIQNGLDDIEKVKLSQAYRKMNESFSEDESVKTVNEKIHEKTKITKKAIEISSELPTQKEWESSLMTFVDKIPFPQIGKGEQCLIKTNLALEHRKNGKEAALILLEEPENHLTHTRLNELLNTIQENHSHKQIIVTTHSSFVANKLSLNNLLILNEKKIARMCELSDETQNYFKKLAGYPTLRLILCKKAVLVEGGSDELIFQKAYKDRFGSLPIQNGIDVISVGLAFKRFLELATKINKYVGVITDNDGDYENKIEKKYFEFKNIPYIRIFADNRNLLNTLEPQFFDVNKDIKELCNIFGIDPSKYNDEKSIISYMENNKTEWALKIFEYEGGLNYPEYINKALEWCNE